MAQLKAGEFAFNPVTGQKVSFTAEELASNPAFGFVSDQFQIFPSQGEFDLQQLGGNIPEPTQPKTFAREVTTGAPQPQFEPPSGTRFPTAPTVALPGGESQSFAPRVATPDPEAVQRNASFINPVTSIGGLSLREDLAPEQITSIQNLISSDRAFNETDAQNFAFAVGAPESAADFVGARGSQLVEQAAKGEQLPSQLEVEIPELDVPLDIPSNVLDTAFQFPKTTEDINRLVQQNQALQQQILGQLAPGEAELALQTQVADVAQQAKALILSAKEGILDVKAQPIAMQFIVGQARNIEERANLQLETLQAQEENLLTRLGLEQENRQIGIDVLTNQLAFNQQNLDTAFAIQDRLQAQEDRVFERAQFLRSDSRDVLTGILEQFEGIDFEDLSSAQQQQLTQLANQAGIPVDLLAAGMSNVKNQLMQTNLLEGATGLSKEQIQIMQNIQSQVSRDPVLKDFNEVDNAKSRIDAALRSKSAEGILTPAGDLALIFSFMKMLDPGSVVREGEFATAQNSTGVPGQIRNQYNKLLQGNRLNADQVIDFSARAEDLYEQNLQRVRPTLEFYQNQADSFGVDSSLISPLLSTRSGALSQGLPALRPLDRSFNDLNSLLDSFPEYLDVIQDIADAEPSASPQEILEIIQGVGSGFNSDLSRSLNGSTPSMLQTSSSRLRRLTNEQTLLSRLGRGTVTGIDGSSLWKNGLDFVLSGGKGAPVPSPFSGIVTFVGRNGGFGNQVKIRTDDGSEIWLSHLDMSTVKPGQSIRAGQLLGTQGNSGSVLGGSGEKLTPRQIAQGRGTHLDLTIKKPDGSFYSSREVAGILGDTRLT